MQQLLLMNDSLYLTKYIIKYYGINYPQGSLLLEFVKLHETGFRLCFEYLPD